MYKTAAVGCIIDVHGRTSAVGAAIAMDGGGGYDSMDGGGTSPWTGEGRTMQEQLSRIAPGVAIESNTGAVTGMRRSGFVRGRTYGSMDGQERS